MGRIPVLKPREVESSVSFRFVRVVHTGSFVIRTAGNTTVPVHQGRDVSPILLRQIAKDIGLTVDEFLKHL